MGNPPGPATRPDRELVLAFQAGDDAAYAELYHRHRDRVARVCHRFLRNRTDAEEAIQETFLKAFQALPRFNGQYQVGAWLGRIASNVCVDHLRSKSRSHLVALPADDVSVVYEKGPEEILIGDHPEIDEAISGITTLHADALKMRAVDGLSHVEIAGRLDMTPAQVKALLHRARLSFRRAWDKAQGWLLAPLVKVRSLDRSEMSGATSNLAVLSTHAPALAEKAAASVLIVMVALAGNTAPARVQDPNIGAAIAGSRTERIKPPGRVVAVQGRSSATNDASTSSEPIDLVTALPETLKATVEGNGKMHEQEEPSDPTGGGSETVTSSVKQTPKKAKETAAGVLDLIDGEAD